MASGCGRIISDTRPGVKVCWILVTSCALVDSLDAEPERALAIKTHHHGCRSSAFEHIGRRWVVGQVAVVVGPAHARRLRGPWHEIAHAKISRCCGGRKENSGYSEGSNCRLAVAGHDFPLRDLKLIKSRAGARDWQLPRMSPDRVTFGISLCDLSPIAGDFSDLRRQGDLARPVASEEQPAPPQHEHNFDGEGTRHQHPMQRPRTAFNPASDHDP
jgi:hypothetical protein